MENLEKSIINIETEMNSNKNLQCHEKLLNMLGSMQPLAHQIPVPLKTMKVFLEEVCLEMPYL